MYDENGVATVTLVGAMGKKFAGITCTGTKDNMRCVEGENTFLTANNIANNSSFYGKYITNYVAPTINDVNYNNYNSSLTDDTKKWMIFYIGDAGNGTNHIYLISSDYINYTYMPKTKTGKSLNGSGYNIYFNNVLSDYPNGSDDVTSETRYLNKQFFKYLEDNNIKSTAENIKASAYMLDTSLWNVFKNEYADFAIGGPTIELFIKSYNDKYNGDYKIENHKDLYQTKIASQVGYQISIDGGENWANYYRNSLMQNDGLYTVNGVTTRYWISSPNSNNNGNIFCTENLNSLMLGPYVTGIEGWGLRPVIRISENVRLEKDGDNYRIVK